MPATPRPSDGRDRLVDALRGGGALAVVLHHLNALPFLGSPHPAPWWSRITAYGYLGVPVFFVLSGFCIGHSWLKSPDASGFFRRRLRRIYPAYLASVFLTLGVVALRKWHFGINDLSALPRSPAHILATVSLLTEPASHYKTINWVYWSLTNEIFYYLALGSLLWIPGGKTRGRILIALHIVCCALQPWADNLRDTPLFFVDHWNMFALGIGACLAAARAPETRWFLGISALQLLAQGLRGSLTLYEPIGAAIVLLLAFPHERFEPGRRNPLVAVGKISYSLYLVHVPVGVYFFMTFGGHSLATSPGRFFLSQACGLALCLAAAALFFRAFERPFLSSRNRIPT